MVYIMILQGTTSLSLKKRKEKQFGVFFLFVFTQACDSNKLCFLPGPNKMD